MRNRASAKPVHERNPACEFAEYLPISKGEGATYLIQVFRHILLTVD